MKFLFQRRTLYNPNLPIHQIWDKNVHPYQPCALWQIEIKDGKEYELFSQVKNLPYNKHVLAQTYFWIGELSYKMGRIDEAIEHLEKYILDPIEIGEITKKHANYTLGYCHLKNNNYTKALQLFIIAADFNPYAESSAYQKALHAPGSHQ